jgi:tetratricopeptide (TPR) repeat protein
VVADICTRLDGLPWPSSSQPPGPAPFSLPQISSRLNDRFRLLTGGSRTALPRQQTLRAVVDWSYELLFDGEQRAFERLAVFPGGCDLATAEAVCADETLDAAALEDLIHALVEKSLVIANPSGDTPRFTLLQTLAQYGRERLTERGNAGHIRDAMAKHYARLCAQSAAAYTGDRQRAWLTAIDQEHDNLRAALDWALDSDDAETALTIAGGCAWPHWLTGRVIEGKRWIDDAFACKGDVDERTRALALTGRGLIDFLLGAAQDEDEDLEEALEIFARHGDHESMALAHSFYAEQAAVRGDLEEARRRRLVSLDLYGLLPDEPFAIAARAFSQAKLAALDGDLAEAERHYRAATEGFGRLDRPVMSSICLGMVADFDERAGDFPAAIKALEDAIETNAALLGGYTGSLHARLGWVLLLDGQLGRAEAVYERALASARRVRYTVVLFQSLAGLAALHRIHGRSDEAVAAGTEALEHYRAGGFARFRNRIDPTSDLQVAAAVCCTVLATVAVEGDEPERAASLLGQADRLRSDAGPTSRRSSTTTCERAEERAAAALGPAVFLVAFERGTDGGPGASRPEAASAAARPQVSALPDGAACPRSGRGPIQEDPRERIPVPPRPKQRPPPVPGAGASGWWPPSPSWHCRAARRRVRRQRACAGVRVPARRRRPDDRFPSQGGLSARIVLHADDGRLDDADHATVADRARAQLARGRRCRRVTDPFAAGSAAISADGQTAYLDVTYGVDKLTVRAPGRRHGVTDAARDGACRSS